MVFAAVELKSTKAAELLVAEGANIMAKNADGRWAMQLAKEAEDDQMITYLKSVKSISYRADTEKSADEEKSDEGGGVVIPTPSPSPEESPYITSWAAFFMS